MKHENDVALMRLSTAMVALSQCKTAMDAKHVSDVAEAARIYLARTNAGIDAVNEATEIRILAERHMGKFLAEMDKANSSDAQRARYLVGTKPAQTLDNMGITKKQSARAQRLAAVPDEEFAAALDKAKRTAARLTIKAVVQHVVANPAEVADTTRKQIVMDFDALDGMKFGCIYADPPWRYSNQGTRAATNNHYQTMTVEDIAALPVESIAADKAHLHMWVTNAFIEEAFKIIRSWGFEFKSTFVWVKPQMGIGNYWRNSHEIMLLAVRGGLTAQSKSEMSWLECGRGKHSAKPDEVRHRIERLSPGPYLELFGRRGVSGWTVMGNQVADELV